MDTISALGLLGSLIATTIDKLGNIKKISKQKFSKEILFLFEIFNSVELDITKVTNDLRAYLKSSGKVRVGYLQNAGLHIENLKKDCDTFLRWVEQRYVLRSLFDVFVPKAKSSIDEIIDFEKKLANSVYFRNDLFNELRINLQPIENPKEIYLPPSNYVNKIIVEMQRLKTKIKKAKIEIRKYAQANMKTDDFFL